MVLHNVRKSTMELISEHANIDSVSEESNDKETSVSLVTVNTKNTQLPNTCNPITKDKKMRKTLRKSNVHVKFVTNTTKESRQCLHERLVNLGFTIQLNEIWSSLWAARDAVFLRGLRPLLLVDDAALEDFVGDAAESDGDKYDSVVIGLAPDKFNYTQLNKAFRILLTGAPLIAIHEGRYYKRLDGLALGPGPFVKGLEYAASCKAEVVGKPSAAFFKSALGSIQPGEAVMIGDDVNDDIDGAQKVGMRGILVQTGKYREGDEAKISPPPSQVCSNFAEAVNILLKELE